MLFNNLPQDDLGTGRGNVLHRLPGTGSSTATHWRLRRPTSGVSMHSEATRHGVGGPGCARSLARPRAARHHIRRDARVWAQPKWTLAFRRVRPGPKAGLSPSRPARDTSSGSPCRAHASGVEIGRNDWAAPEPVTGWNECLVDSVARVPACRAGSRGFDSRTRRQIGRAEEPMTVRHLPPGPTAGMCLGVAAARWKRCGMWPHRGRPCIRP